MKRYQLSEVKYNNGNGALLCNLCGVIIKYGFNHEDKLHFCEKCEMTSKEKWEKE